MEIGIGEVENFQTIDDMDLIDILWRQDLDMGVSRDIFDSSLRKELLKTETDILLDQKEEKIKKETCIDNAITTDSDSQITYVIDDETGELVPAPSETVAHNVAINMDTSIQPHTQNELPITFEEAIEILERESRSGSSGSIGPVNPEDGTAPDANSLIMDVVSEADIDSLVRNISQLDSGLTFSRQLSMEGRWTDVEGVIGSPLTTEIQPTKTVNIPNCSLQLNTAPQNIIGSNDIPLPHNTHDIDGSAQLLALDHMSSPQMYSSSDRVLTSLFANTAPAQLHTHTTAENLINELMQTIGSDNANITNMTQVVKKEDNDSAVSSMSSETDYMDNMQDFGDSCPDLIARFDGIDATVDRHMTEQNTIIKLDPNSSGGWNASNLHDELSLHNHSSFGDISAAIDQSVLTNQSDEVKSEKKPRDTKKQKQLNKKINFSKDERRAKAMKLPITVKDIIHTSVEKFTELLHQHQMTESQLQLVKDIRRRGKNKVAAQNCRKRKMEVIETLDECVSRMQREREAAASEHTQLRSQQQQLQQLYSKLYTDVIRSLQDEHGQAYDPDHYSLQHTADGNVFLVPKATSHPKDNPQPPHTQKHRSK